MKTPLQHEIRQSWAFRTSNTDLVEIDDPSLTLRGPLLTLDDPLPIKSAMRYTRSKYHANSLVISDYDVALCTSNNPGPNDDL